MNNHTLYENQEIQTLNDIQERFAVSRLDIRMLLSTIWIAVLFADVLRGVHETLRPGFVSELANEGTVYGNEVTDTTLLAAGFVLCFIIAMVVLARVLPHRSNRWLNGLAGVMMIGGVMSSWPKDPDDLVFGAFQVAGALAVIGLCIRWRTDTDSTNGASVASLRST